MMIVAGSSDVPALGYFRPLEKFNYIEVDEEGIPTVKAIYMPKFTYTIRTAELDAKVTTWVGEGKVRRVEV